MWRILLQALFAGRYGLDALSRLLLIIGLLIEFIALFMVWGFERTLVRTLGLLFLIWACYRMFSRNLPARQAEARRFGFWRQGLRKRWQRFKRQWPRFWNGEWWREQRQYKFLRCPRCHARLRVPRGKGKIVVTCTRCKHKMEEKT